MTNLNPLLDEKLCKTKSEMVDGAACADPANPDISAENRDLPGPERVWVRFANIVAPNIEGIFVNFGDTNIADRPPMHSPRSSCVGSHCPNFGPMAACAPRHK
jgi:hypothetical protein